MRFYLTIFLTLVGLSQVTASDADNHVINGFSVRLRLASEYLLAEENCEVDNVWQKMPPLLVVVISSDPDDVRHILDRNAPAPLYNRASSCGVGYFPAHLCAYLALAES